MNKNTNNTALVISGYKYKDLSKAPELVGSYKLQINPADLSFTVGSKEQSSDQTSDAIGSLISSKAPAKLQKSLDLNFIIDNTGALPNSPTGIDSSSKTLADSIKALEEITVKPLASTHRPPFVRVTWGFGSISIFGEVISFNYDYTFFDAYGVPLRANVKMTIKDFDSDGTNKLFQSPDITKMPIVKKGDNIVNISESYYDDKKYFIKLAEFNNLNSLRALKSGKQIQIPPIR